MGELGVTRVLSEYLVHMDARRAFIWYMKAQSTSFKKSYMRRKLIGKIWVMYDNVKKQRT